jgi:acetolactate synthase-1/2/3 large subunit
MRETFSKYQPAYLFHTASYLTLDSNRYKSRSVKVNVYASALLFELCLEFGVKKVVYSSSASVYGTPTLTPTKEDYPFDVNKPSNYDINTQMVIQKLNEHLINYDDWKITTGVGNHQMWAVQFIDYIKPKSLITSGSLGVMGAGIGYAIGAQFANPKTKVILIDGDGSFNMTLSELQTIVKYKLPIKIALMNDKKMSMVRTWEKLFFDERYIATDLDHNPDYSALANSFGIKSLVCSSIHELDITVKEFLEYPGPILCDFRTISDMCYPLVAPGKALNEMILFQEDNSLHKIDKTEVPS